MVSISSNLTKRFHRWTEFKLALEKRSFARPQFEESDGYYNVWFYDGNECHECQICKGSIPPGDYSQEQNDLDLADFEDNYQAQFNKPIDSRSSDSVPFVSTNIFPPQCILYFTGAGDSSTVRGAGSDFSLTSDVEGDVSVDFGFLDGVYLAGGGISWSGASIEDKASIEALAPATPVTPSGDNTGNCNLVDPGVGAPILIVPASGNGAFNVDLNLAVPVPAIDEDTLSGTGFYNATDPWTGTPIVSVGIPTQSKWNLFSIPITLARLANKIPLLGDGNRELIIPTIKPKYFLPQWKFKTTLHNSGHAGLKMIWFMTMARKQTV